MNTVTLTRKAGIVEEMSLSSFARWACLIEAFEFIDEKAGELGLNLEDVVKPLAIDQYINERFPAMLHDVTIESKSGNI
jgi:hypothetical protein